MTKPNTSKNQSDIIQQAIAGEPRARQQVNLWVDPLIRFHSARMCKRFCKENRYRYQCSLLQPLPGASGDAPLCEWGNGSYAWMLDELTRKTRLERFRGENGASFYDYAFCIANSLPFYERWKDWRFGRRLYVPSYIDAIGADARGVFLALRQQDPMPLIAQNLKLSMQRVEDLAANIVNQLVQRQRLHLLQPDCTASIDSDDPESAGPEISDPGPEPAALLELAEVQSAWEQLDAVEQFVLEALVIDEQDANDVLAALQQLDIAIHPKTSASDTNRQQLYYFKRKTLAKLEQLVVE